jgi:hypothetical protein
VPEGTPQQAMRRVADAILAGDYMTAMAEATPETLLQAMQLGGGVMNLPPPDRCDIEVLDAANGEYRFRVRFHAGQHSLSATVAWQDVEGAWKITGISDVQTAAE